MNFLRSFLAAACKTNASYLALYIIFQNQMLLILRRDVLATVSFFVLLRICNVLRMLNASKTSVFTQTGQTDKKLTLCSVRLRKYQRKNQVNWPEFSKELHNFLTFVLRSPAKKKTIKTASYTIIA